jgi:hypothetical protein
MIDVTIPFCTYDIKYINRTIEAIRPIANKIIVTYCDKFFNGEDENLDLIQSIIDKNTDCIFYKIEYESDKSSRYHSNKSRDIACQISKSDHIIFLDADEIFEKNKLYEWYQENKNILSDISSFSNYWYYRDERYRVSHIDDSVIMINKKYATSNFIYSEYERSIFKFLNIENKQLNIVDKNGLPFCHHYSWVLDKANMIRKVTTWSHKDDKNWTPLVEEEFSREFNGTDVLGNSDFIILEKSSTC